MPATASETGRFGAGLLENPVPRRGALQATPVDVIVTDASMAGMNGVELCERIVANHPDLPVMLLTAVGALIRQDRDRR